MVGKKDKYLIAAQKFIERGQLDKALVEFGKVVQEDPKDTRTWLKMAEIHAKRGANAEATEIYLRTGALYTEQGFAQKAVAVYKNVLKLSPGTVAAHLKLGEVFKQIGLVSDAVQQFELAAATLQKLNKPTEAVAAVRQAVETQPENVVLRVKLAESASQAGLVDEAIKEFGKAADQLKAQGRADESLRVVERMLFHQPDNFAKARELAEAYIAKGSPRLALPKLQACLKGDARDPRTLSLLARALEQLGQVPKAVSVLKELVRLCQDLGRSSERDAAILRGLTLDPTDVELRALAVRNRLRGAASAAGEATPLPVGSPSGPPADRGGSFDLSGAVRITTGASGRVVAPVGVPESGARVPTPGVSLGSGGAAAFDVSRILAEADVFVKYGLLERAADHLARVFELDAEQRDAREKLISVLQRLGRKEDAVRHLEILARQVARTSASEAKKLAQRALTLDPQAGGARALFETLAAGGETPDALEITIDDEREPTAFASLTPPFGNDPPAVAAAATPPPLIDATPPPLAAAMRSLNIAATPPPVAATTPPPPMEATPPPNMRATLSMDAGDTPPLDIAPSSSFDEGATPPPHLPANDLIGALAGELAGERAEAQAEEDDLAFDDEVSTGDVVSIEAQRDLSGGFDDVTESGADVITPLPPSAGSVGTRTLDPEPPELPELGEEPDVDVTSDRVGDIDPDEFEDLAAAFADDPAPVGSGLGLAAGLTDSDEDELSAELDQVTFFVEQSLPDEARALLQDLEARFSRHPRLVAKLQEVREFEAGLGASDAAGSPEAGVPALRSTVIEGPAAGVYATPPPRAVLAEADAGDTSTHADLGIAYKEMGLFDAAIGELKLLTQDPQREVFALTMMGECYEAKGSFTEAVLRYKRALNCQEVTKEEMRSLYFLLGGAFERLGDVSEALYFYEKVAKRDPKFRAVEQKIAELKPRLVKRAR